MHSGDIDSCFVHIFCIIKRQKPFLKERNGIMAFSKEQPKTSGLLKTPEKKFIPV